MLARFLLVLVLHIIFTENTELNMMDSFNDPVGSSFSLLNVGN